MSVRSLTLLAAASALALSLAEAQAQSPIPRQGPSAGAIVAAKGGEEMRFVREDLWRAAALQQNVVGGDTLRTNAIGNLAILFADQTQIRVGRNSTLTVNDVAAGNAGTTELSLQSGNIWARAARGGTGVDVKTPAAVAAIRGTDWSLSVEGGRTSLIVLEGVVELTNSQGTVTVRQGEGAVVSIGQAPTKFVLTNSNDREQMLFYLSLRETFSSLSTTPLTGPGLRAERARIKALAPEARSAEDWLTLAEIAPSYDGRDVATQALAEARKRRLSTAQRARADMVEAALLGSQHRWSEAAALFAKAERGVDPKRRALASYGRYITQSLADPKRIYAEPAASANDAWGALAHAYVVAFKQDLNAAADVLKAAEKRFPNDARIAAAAATVAYTLNRRDDMRASIARAKALDPDDPEVIAADSSIRGDIDGEVNGAVESLRRALETAPGNAGLWNTLGLFESDRDRPIAAEEALRRAIAEDPWSPVAYANLAIFLLDQSRVEEAGALIDKALSLDPGFHVAYLARGRYLLQKGESAKGLEAILAGSAANPGLSQGLLLTALAYYQDGDDELAIQALDNADRLDPNDPVVSSVRTGIAIDQYQADQAVLAARETLRRYRQRGGDFTGIAVNKDGGSYPAQAYRFLNLNEWSRFYGDRVFDPFTASSYFDQSAVQRPRVFTQKPDVSTIETGVDTDMTALNLTIQGLFFDPLAVSGRIGRPDFIRRPFLDVEVGGAALRHNGRWGWGAEATAQGFSNEPLPTSFTLTASRAKANGRDLIDKEGADSGAFFVGMAPSASDRFLVFGAGANRDPALASISTPSSLLNATLDSTAMLGGAGWSHSFSDRNVLTGAVFGINALDRRYGEVAVVSPTNPNFIEGGTNWTRTRVEGAAASLSHMIGFGDVTLHYGLEAQRGRSTESNSGWGFTFNRVTSTYEKFVNIDDRTSTDFNASRLYADAFWRPFDWLEAQAGIERSTIEVENNDETMIAPRVGIAVSPFEGQWLRAAYRQDMLQPIAFTLAPVTTVGLAPNELPIGFGGETKTLALRWDAEWSPYVFTAVEYQRQEAEDLNIPVAYSVDTLGIGKARIERLAATANLWLTHGFGVFGTVGTVSSKIRSEEAPGADVPFIAGKFARAGVTFVHPSRLKLTFAGTFLSDITGNIEGRPIDDYWTADATLSWETPDRRLLFGLSVLNMFDEKYELALDARGPGRTFEASLKARF
ncbi:tetratricopeptide (TPR) repeat protein [Microvirga flocculans]|uniref:Tetratricopeptide (TPR) repeat protein n=1 Tax=Microvirga flocculans TaxID=217168 RepID=A0A7W6IGV6_9HYPH|nr:FecR domain-containing protein [Microvirga flocculans]MBB4041257.1 tetratricopeptide (TPR) repeat protein [Microvirga flocculans]